MEDIRLQELKEKGYKDLGWENGGSRFPPNVYPQETIDLSLFRNRGTHIVYINHDHKLILHVDMSD